MTDPKKEFPPLTGVEYRGPGGATIWKDGRHWSNLPAVGTTIYHAEQPYLVTDVVTFSTARAPCVFVKRNATPMPRSIKLPE